LAAGLNAVDPYQAVCNHLQCDGKLLYAGDWLINLNEIGRIFLISVGKAAVPMAEGLRSMHGDSISKGVVVTKKGQLKKGVDLPPEIDVIEAGHPLPDQQSIHGAQTIIRLLRETKPDDLILCCISGGGSALMSLPKNGISLDEVQALTTLLLACGATIDEINTIRKHIDGVKGGGLLTQARNSKWITLVLSDVIGDPLDRIASGPTVPDPSTYADSYHILEQYNLLDRVPASIVSHLKQGIKGIVQETLKPGNPVFQQVNNLIVGNNSIAAEASAQAAESAHFHTLLLTTSIQGEANQVGQVFGAIARQLAISNRPVAKPACIIAGGETTVTLQGNGYGGRNQELALGAVNLIAGLENVILVTLATDGGDGPTDAAGAVVSGETLGRAQTLGLDSRDFLLRNDSYHFFKPLDDLLKPGATSTNVGDLIYLFGF
jgi:hydroxypyruvate reductase